MMRKGLIRKKLIIAGALLLTGCGLGGHAPAPQKQHYRCGTLPLTVTLDQTQQQVKVILDGKALTLTRQISASGARYSDGTYTFWSKGDRAFIQRNQRIVINDCQLQSPG